MALCVRSIVIEGRGGCGRLSCGSNCQTNHAPRARAFEFVICIPQNAFGHISPVSGLKSVGADKDTEDTMFSICLGGSNFRQSRYVRGGKMCNAGALCQEFLLRN